MAERSVSVKLSARVDQYVAAMAQAKAATTGMSAESQRNLTRLGGQMQSFGRSATLGVTVPLLALGAGAVAMAAKFDTAFAQMVGLANVPANEVDGLKESVLALAGDTAQAPQDLAEALYFAASAGLDSAQAMDAVELAARGAAAGMGSAQDIVGLVASATASYGEANISAAEATDILTATIREGRAEPAELAATLGRVLPIASQMGITFAEVGGATAYLTNIMGGADISTTALRDALMKLSAPGQAAKDALVAMGTSFGELQSAIAQDGLLGALDLLRTHGFDKNAEALHALVPDAQGYLALTALLNDESGQLAGTIDAVTNSAGSLDFAFNAVSDTSGFKMKQAVTDIKIAMIEAGDILLPIAASIASAIGDLAHWFSNLSPDVQTVAIAFGGLAAVIGPIVFIAGSFIKNLVAIKAAFGLLSAGAATATLAIAGIGAALVIGYMAYRSFTQNQRDTDEVTRNVVGALDEQVASLFAVEGAAIAAGGGIGGVAVANEALSLSLAEGNEALTAALSTLNVSAEDTLEVLSLYAEDPVAALEMLAESFGLTRGQAALFASAMADQTSVEGMFSAAENLAEGLRLPKDQMAALVVAWLQFNDAADETDLNAIAQEFLNGRVSAEGYEGSLVAAAESNLGFTRTTGDALAVYREWARLVGESDAATMAAASGADELTVAIEGTTEAAADVAPTLDAVTRRYDVLSSATIGATATLDMIVNKFDAVGEAAKNTVSDFGDMTDATRLLNTDMLGAVGTVQEVVDALDRGGDAWRKSDEMFAGLGDAASDAAGGFADLEQAVDDLWAAFDNIMNPADDLRAAARDVNSTIEDMTTNFDDAAIASTNAALAFDVTSDAGRGQEEQFIAARDAIYEHGQQLMLNGASAEEAAGDIAFNTQSLHDNMIAAGYSEDAVAALNAEYFLTPSQLLTELQTIGMAQAAAEIAHHKAALGEIPTHATTTVDVAVDENDIGKVNSQLAGIVNQIRTAYVGVSGPGAKGSGGGVYYHALGAYIPRPEFAMLHGNEAVLPLSNPPRMRELVGDPRIGEPLMAALAGTMTPAASYGYQNAPTATMERADLPAIIIHNNGRDITSHDIANAIVESRTRAGR